MSDDEPATIVLVGIKEDTVMGNADASSANPDTDTVSIPFLAAIACTADEVIAHIQQMSIDDEVEIVVNKDPTTGNIVEGHKVAPKFKKNKAKENAVCLLNYSSRSPCFLSEFVETSAARARGGDFPALCSSARP